MPVPAGRVGAVPLTYVLGLLFAALSAQYLLAGISVAAHAPLWMDEVLALWTARLGGPRAIWSALEHGAEFNPPLYHFLLAVLLKLGLASPLALRLPSILAFYAASLFIGSIAWRRAGPAAAAVAAAVVLSSGAFTYAVQARPYALAAAAFAAALALYDQNLDRRPSWRACGALAALLAAACGLSTYAVLLGVTLAVLEVVLAVRAGRAPCTRTLIAVAMGTGSVLIWTPILLAARHASAADVSAPAYYGQPTLFALARSIVLLTGWLIIPLLAVWGYALARGTARRDSRLALTACVLTAVPLIVFGFALLVSHSFADRYVLAGAFGLGLLFACAIARLDWRADGVAVVLLLLLLIGNWNRDSGELGSARRLDALSIVSRAPGDLPIVTGDGLRWFEITANAPPDVARRLTFLNVAGVSLRDPTNAHQVLRWKTIRPNLAIVDAGAFLCATPAFLLFSEPGTSATDPLPQWLSQRATLVPHENSPLLTLVKPHPCSKARP